MCVCNVHVCVHLFGRANSFENIVTDIDEFHSACLHSRLTVSLLSILFYCLPGLKKRGSNMSVVKRVKISSNMPKKNEFCAVEKNCHKMFAKTATKCVGVYYFNNNKNNGTKPIVIVFSFVISRFAFARRRAKKADRRKTLLIQFLAQLDSSDRFWCSFHVCSLVLERIYSIST